MLYLCILKNAEMDNPKLLDSTMCSNQFALARRTVLRLAVLMFLLTGTVFAQQEHARAWRRGPLALNEFAIMSTQPGATSHLDYALRYALVAETEGLHTYYYCRVGAVMYPGLSWMAESSRDSAELSYNQALFDLVEIHRRQMQWQTLYVTSRKKQLDQLLESFSLQLDREVQMMRAVTREGRDVEVLERMRQANRQWLNANPCGHPEFEERYFWWSMGLDMGFVAPMGGLGHYFSASAGSLGFNLAMGWRRHNFTLRSVKSIVHQRDTIRDYWGYTIDPSFMSSPMDRTDVHLSYGFSLVSNDRYAITPYAGWGWSTFSASYWYPITASGFLAGVEGKLHFHHWHVVRNGGKQKARRVSASAHANLFAGYAKCDDLEGQPSGLTVGISLGLTLTEKRERASYHRISDTNKP